MPNPIQTTSSRATSTTTSLSLLSEIYAPPARPGASSHPLLGPALPPLESNPDRSSFSHRTNSSQSHHYSSASTLRGRPPSAASASSSASSSYYSISSPLIFRVIGILMMASVAVLGLSILSWFLKRCCYCYSGTGGRRTRRSYLRDRDRNQNRDADDDQDTVSLHLNELQGHRERLRARYEELETDAWNSSVPSHICIPSGNSIGNGNGNGNGNANGNGNRESRTNPTKGNAAVSERPRRFAQSQRRRRRRRRNFFCTMSFYQHQEAREEGDESTALTTLSRDSSLASLRSTARKGAESAMASPSPSPLPLPSPLPSSSKSAPVDPSGLRLRHAGTTTSSDTESFPHATIQFKIPINGSFDGCDDGRNGGSVDLDLLRDFLSHTEDYVSYPRCKLTILLRARAPCTPKEEEELSRLRSMVEDAAAFSTLPSTLPSPSPLPPSAGGRTTTTTTATTIVAAGEELLQVCVVTACGEHDELLRCAPTGGLLVTFGWVGELPVGHSGFLRDLIV
mmetsp:Transcript_19295/g.53816  ORF Transcript_19295/g.53816 Transcript_19295/m.53816 type:complete len:511 (-) Transcript_19295:135-1667(-)